MSTNAQPRVLGRWSRTSWWRTLVHARRAFVAPADATSASCDVRSRDDSGRQRPRVAPFADRNVHGPRRLRSVTSASRNVERIYVSERRDVSERNVEHRYVSERCNRYVSERCEVSEPQRQRRATSSAQRQARNGKRATWARRYVKAPKTSAWRKAGLRCSWQRTRPFSRNDELHPTNY